MGHILGSWSGMPKYLEEDMLRPALRGFVRYDCTTFVGMDGCRVISLLLEGKPFKRFSWETVNSWFIAKGYAEKTSPMGTVEYWQGLPALLEQYPKEMRTEYTDGEFCAALSAYRNQKIGDSLFSTNPIVRMFALLGRRAGVRALKRVGETLDAGPAWLDDVYAFLMRKLDA